jgi:hypothetical protein
VREDIGEHGRTEDGADAEDPCVGAANDADEVVTGSRGSRRPRRARARSMARTNRLEGESQIHSQNSTDKKGKRTASSPGGYGRARESQRRTGVTGFRRRSDGKKRAMSSVQSSSRQFFVQRPYWRQVEVDGEFGLSRESSSTAPWRDAATVASGAHREEEKDGEREKRPW